MSDNNDMLATCSTDELEEVTGGIAPLLIIGGLFLLGLASGCDASKSGTDNQGGQ